MGNVRTGVWEENIPVNQDIQITSGKINFCNNICMSFQNYVNFSGALLEYLKSSTAFRETGMLTMGAPGDTFTKGTIRCLQRHGIPHQVMDYQGVKQAYPMIEFPRNYTFVVDKSGGILRADKALISYQVRTVTGRTGGRGVNL